MREAEYSGQFKRDVKQAQRRGKDMDKLKTLLGLLIAGVESCRDATKTIP